MWTAVIEENVTLFLSKSIITLEDALNYSNFSLFTDVAELNLVLHCFCLMSQWPTLHRGWALAERGPSPDRSHSLYSWVAKNCTLIGNKKVANRPNVIACTKQAPIPSVLVGKTQQALLCSPM